MLVTELNGDSSRLARQPTINDPFEIEIRKKLEAYYSSETSRSVISTLRDEQRKFFSFAFDNIESPDKVRKKYKDLLGKLTLIGNAKILSGVDRLQGLEGKHYIIITNHLGIAKLTRISNHDRVFPVDLDEFEAFPSRHASLMPIADKLDANLYETATELPGKLLDIQKACEVLTIPPSGSGRTEILIKEVSSIRQRGSKSLIVMYPEGGTSGKKNQAGPYDLDGFHRGSFVVAMKAGVDILPVCQYFNPKGSFDLHILDLIPHQEIGLENLPNVMDRAKASMQEKLESSQQN